SPIHHVVPGRFSYVLFPQEQRRSKKSLRKIGIVDLFVLSQIKMKIPADYRKIETRYPDEVLLKKVAW
ncbi:MAG: hypothetical protein AAGK47_07580, partial [Bacteroidota bacterium]